jgi:hypothetical protein
VIGSLYYRYLNKNKYFQEDVITGGLMRKLGKGVILNGYLIFTNVRKMCRTKLRKK